MTKKGADDDDDIEQDQWKCNREIVRLVSATIHKAKNDL